MNIISTASRFTAPTPDAAGDAQLLHALDFLQLELTAACNLQCVHCYTESSPLTGASDRLDAAAYRRLIREAYRLGTRKIQFLGGEPTLNKDLPGLLAYAQTLGYPDIEVYSNLTTHVTPGLLDQAVRLGVRFATTFHSSDPAREDAFTAVRGSFARKVRNIRGIVERKIPIHGSIILATQPREDLQATLGFLKTELGLQDVKIDRVRDFGRGRAGGTAASISELCGNCWRGSLAIAADGTAYACPFARDWPVGNVLDTPLADIAHAGPLLDIRQTVYEDVIRRIDPETKPPETLECASCGPCGPCGPCRPCGPMGSLVVGTRPKTLSEPRRS